MNIANLNKASELAKTLLLKAIENEPPITTDIKAIASAVGVKITGLENKFKSESSLIRKIVDKNASNQIPMPKIAKKINDVLRYTYLLNESVYAENLVAVQHQFERKGYVIRKIFNAWLVAQTPQDTGYRGINVTVISSQNQKFELQFHTRASFKLKTETHGLYEEFRNPETSEARKIKISETVKEKAERLKKPKGI